ncbi:20375_t:CDS:2 [Funneliformis geosporum]|nr:20375_t:CDS:2 [Funneliformis geosporum]
MKLPFHHEYQKRNHGWPNEIGKVKIDLKLIYKRKLGYWKSIYKNQVEKIHVAAIDPRVLSQLIMETLETMILIAFFPFLVNQERDQFKKLGVRGKKIVTYILAWSSNNQLPKDWMLFLVIVAKGYILSGYLVENPRNMDVFT